MGFTADLQNFTQIFLNPQQVKPVKMHSSLLCSGIAYTQQSKDVTVASINVFAQSSAYISYE